MSDEQTDVLALANELIRCSQWPGDYYDVAAREIRRLAEREANATASATQMGGEILGLRATVSRLLQDRDAAVAAAWEAAAMKCRAVRESAQSFSHESTCFSTRLNVDRLEGARTAAIKCEEAIRAAAPKAPR